MGLKYTRGKITTGSLSYCPYWSDCGTIASYCRVIAGPARQPSFPYSLIRVIPSLLTAAPLPSPIPIRTPARSGATPRRQSPRWHTDSAPRRQCRGPGDEKKGRKPAPVQGKAAAQTAIQNTTHRIQIFQSSLSISISLWRAGFPAPHPYATTRGPWSDLPGCPPSSPLPSPASSGSRRFPP